MPVIYFNNFRGFNETFLSLKNINFFVGENTTVDPDEFIYPWQSPYVAAGNSPILLIDIEGEGPGLPPGLVGGGNVIFVNESNPDGRGDLPSDFQGADNGEWDVIPISNFEDAAAMAAAYKLKYGSINNLIIVAHGMPGYFEVQSQNTRTGMTNGVFEKYNNGKLKNKIQLGVINTIKILGKSLSDKSNVVFSSCRTGRDAKIAKNIHRLLSERKNNVTLYTNLDYGGATSGGKNTRDPNNKNTGLEGRIRFDTNINLVDKPGDKYGGWRKTTNDFNDPIGKFLRIHYDGGISLIRDLTRVLDTNIQFKNDSGKPKGEFKGKTRTAGDGKEVQY